MKTQETFLFDKIIFGPVKSRRLGLSLGINLLPEDYKLCNFDCIYCECGWSKKIQRVSNRLFHLRSEVKKALTETLIQLKLKNIIPDAITFAGNGEPTLHPEFSAIIDDTINLRNEYLPNAKVAVLTNATMLNRSNIVDALKKVDMRILKLDAGTEKVFQQLNQPKSKRPIQWIVEHLQSFNGDLIIQTMFLKGYHNGVFIDNTTEENLAAWLIQLEKIRPKQVMIYSIDRATAEKGLEKISKEELENIALRVNRLGISTMVG